MTPRASLCCATNPAHAGCHNLRRRWCRAHRHAHMVVGRARRTTRARAHTPSAMTPHRVGHGVRWPIGKNGVARCPPPGDGSGALPQHHIIVRGTGCAATMPPLVVCGRVSTTVVVHTARVHMPENATSLVARSKLRRCASGGPLGVRPRGEPVPGHRAWTGRAALRIHGASEPRQRRAWQGTSLSHGRSTKLIPAATTSRRRSLPSIGRVEREQSTKEEAATAAATASPATMRTTSARKRKRPSINEVGRGSAVRDGRGPAHVGAAPTAPSKRDKPTTMRPGNSKSVVDTEGTLEVFIDKFHGDTEEKFVARAAAAFSVRARGQADVQRQSASTVLSPGSRSICGEGGA